MEIDETDGKDRHIYRLKKIEEIQEILIAERDKRNELSIKYNRGVNIIGVIYSCLDVTAIGLGITGVFLVFSQQLLMHQPLLEWKQYQLLWDYFEL